MKSSTLTVLLVAASVLGLSLWGWMLWLTWDESSPNALLVHLGETGATLAVLILAVNLLGDWLRDAFNPKLR